MLSMAELIFASQKFLSSSDIWWMHRTVSQSLVAAEVLERQLADIFEKPVVIGCLLSLCNVTNDYVNGQYHEVWSAC